MEEAIQREWRLSDAYREASHDSYRAVCGLLEDCFEHCAIYEPVRQQELMTSELRIKPNTVFKVGSSLSEIVEGLGLIYAVFTITPLAFLAKAALGKQLLDVAKRLFECWEVLDDPDERVVFEAVFRLQGKRSGDILRLRDYSQAPALLESDVAGICVEVGSSLTEREVVKTLASLRHRGIVSERDGRWRIVF